MGACRRPRVTKAPVKRWTQMGEMGGHGFLDKRETPEAPRLLQARDWGTAEGAQSWASQAKGMVLPGNCPAPNTLIWLWVVGL